MPRTLPRYRPSRGALVLLALALGLLLALAGHVRAEEVVETAEDGTVLVRYRTDEEGRKQGRYERWYPSGQLAVEAHYKDDRLHGSERTFDEDGDPRAANTYRAGALHGACRTFDDEGRLQVQAYYRDGLLHGACKHYHPNRRLHIVTRYRNGALHGPYQVWDDAGVTVLRTTYQEGLLHGTYERFAGKTLLTSQVWEAGVPREIDGIVPFARTQEAIRTELARLLEDGTPATDDLLDVDRLLALRQLKAYRYLADVPYADLALDGSYNALAQAASEICHAIGHITHAPANPGWPADRYDVAARGAKNSNLHSGNRACTSVRGYMDDSDPTNIDRVGHRCWCLHPEMLKTGFGHDDGFTAMWALDGSRAKVPPYAFVALPPPGYVPGAWLAAHWAWSVSLNPETFDAPVAGAVKAVIEPVGEDFLPTGEPLTLDYSNTKADSAGIPYLVIFRPVGASLEAGSRYRVTVNGLTHKGKPKALAWFVEFFDVPYVTPRLPGRETR